jgi:hypothetical protein
MKADIQIELEPFSTPNFVRQTNVSLLPGAEPGCFPLSALSAEALDRLCDQFRAEVFEKAGKRDPGLDRPMAA